jgi:SAM-dependent methyltransferase
MTPIVTDGARASFARIVAAGFGEKQVAAWFGVPLVTDARYVAARPDRVRRGAGAWIALLVAGETVDERSLGEQAKPLVEAGFLARAEGGVRACVRVLPVRELLIACDGELDVSALNCAACLPSRLEGAALDVGCGAGLLTLLCARAGAEAIGVDVDARALAFARLNAALNGIQARFVEGDLFAGERGPFAHIAFNAPLVRAPLAADPLASPRYLSSPRGESLALEFLRGLDERLAPDGEALLHAQLTPAVDAALAALPRATVSLTFAEAPDGTPHALHSLRKGAGRRAIATPLGPLLPHLRRELLDAYHAPRTLAPDATPLAAPWLVLRDERQLGGRWRAQRFGAAAIDDADRALLESLDGKSLAELSVDHDRLRDLIERGLVIVR